MGCKVAGVYMGAVVFCDNLLPLAPTRDGMQVMLDTYHMFASRYKSAVIHRHKSGEKQDKVHICLWPSQESANLI